tara:strand:+ start:124 stop:480 length:357 start_codon:yes stop_codon:yes gene_type:complete
MELSSPRFKALAVSAGFTFWFLIITNTVGLFSIEYFIIFTFSVLIIMQLLSTKVSKVLDMIAIFNTKLFLSILFVFVISIYGILFKLLRIDLLRLKKQNNSYWLDVEETKHSRIRKQY